MTLSLWHSFIAITVPLFILGGLALGLILVHISDKRDRKRARDAKKHEAPAS